MVSLQSPLYVHFLAQWGLAGVILCALEWPKALGVYLLLCWLCCLVIQRGWAFVASMFDLQSCLRGLFIVRGLHATRAVAVYQSLFGGSMDNAGLRSIWPI